MRIESAAFKAILTAIRGGIPKLFPRASIAAVPIVEWEMRRAGFAEHGVDVVGLVFGASDAGLGLEVKVLGMYALDAGMFVPEVALIFKAFTGLGGGIEASPCSAQQASTVLLAVGIALPTLVAGAPVFEFLILGTRAVSLAVRLLSARALGLLALAGGLTVGGALCTRDAGVATLVEVVGCVAGHALVIGKVWFLRGADAGGGGGVCDGSIEAVALAGGGVEAGGRGAGGRFGRVGGLVMEVERGCCQEQEGKDQ